MFNDYLIDPSQGEEDVLVVGEEDESVVTFSPSILTSLTKRCINQCGYCSFSAQDSLSVPYSTIKGGKIAREKGIRSIHYIAGESPDHFPEIRATLDLWGFNSYGEYLYNVCELGFLEGLIPVLEIGSLSKETLETVSEIIGGVKVMLDSVNAKVYNQVYPNSPGKHIEKRLKMLQLTGRMGIPTMTGIMVGIGESVSHRRNALEVIAKLHKTFGHIHEVTIQNFVPQEGTAFESKKPASHKEMLKTVGMALEILPEDILVNVPFHMVDNPIDYIDLGIRDLGVVPFGKYVAHSSTAASIDKTVSEIRKAGYTLQQRFPLKQSFIRNGQYSDKLGQVLDAYKYRLKKRDQEKSKELKLSMVAG